MRSEDLVAARKNSGNDGLSLIARKVCTMENTQPTTTENEAGKPVDILDASTKSGPAEAMESSASTSSSPSTGAGTPSASRKIWKSAALDELKLKAGLVAGALADFQTAKGTVVVQETKYTAPSGRECRAIKLFLVVEDVDLVAVRTADGIDFDLVADTDEAR